MTVGLHLAHVTNYRIVADANDAALARKIEEEIHNGWQPFGSLAMGEGPDGERLFSQPVVKYAEWFR